MSGERMPQRGAELDERLVDAANAVFGAHPRSRALHAKGIWCEGAFTATPAAGRLTRAAHMRGEPVPALIRFSNASGDPHSHDANRDGRGMAVKLRPGGGEETDLLATMAPSFTSRTPEDFLELLELRRPDPETGKPDLEQLGEYLGRHPEALPSVQGVIGVEPPASYVTIPYFSPHAFRLVDAEGDGTWIRYRWVPANEQRLTDDEARALGRDYLGEELARRLGEGPARLGLRLQLAAEDDPLDDPTAVWPEEREILDAGEVEIVAIVEDPEASGEAVVFDPTRVADGVELPDDPILHARPRAYSVSVDRRAG